MNRFRHTGRQLITSETPTQLQPPDSGGNQVAWDAYAEPVTIRHRGVMWFLLLAFPGAWSLWVVVYLAGGSLDNPIIQLAAAAFIPALSAIIVRRWITRQGFANSGIRLHLRSSWKHYLIAITLPWVVLAVASGLAVATRLWDPASGPGIGSSVWIYLAAGPLICVVAAPLFWGEEFGWTGYLRDRLLPGRPVATTLLTGLIWGVWHWPLPWVGYLGGSTTPIDAIVAMLLWIPLSVLLEFLIGWLWSATASVWPGAMLHAGSNLVVSTGMGELFADVVDGPATTLLLCAGLTPCVIAVIVHGRLGRFTAGR